MATKLWAKNDCAHATGLDFCHIFQEEMQSLYALAFILTNNHNDAEKCFVVSLGDCLSAPSIFKEWAFLWSKRAVIKNAIRLISPQPEKEALHTPDGLELKSQSTPGDALFRLQQFQRFVIVMSVLERCSDQECALLLKCGTQEIVTARGQGLRQLARIAGPRLTAAVFRHEFQLATVASPSSARDAVHGHR